MMLSYDLWAGFENSFSFNWFLFEIIWKYFTNTVITKIILTFITIIIISLLSVTSTLFIITNITVMISISIYIIITKNKTILTITIIIIIVNLFWTFLAIGYWRQVQHKPIRSALVINSPQNHHHQHHMVFIVYIIMWTFFWSTSLSPPSTSTSLCNYGCKIIVIYDLIWRAFEMLSK